MRALTFGSFVIVAMLVFLPQGGSSFIFRPEKGAMWDPSIIWHDGKYYAFFMYNNAGSSGLVAGHCLLATSTDGVHWEDQGTIIDERGRPDGAIFFKCFVGKCGDKFVMDHGVNRSEGQDLMRFYQSKDLRNWEYSAAMEPDARWYSRERWDHMYILPKEEGKPDAGYWGYIVAVSREPSHLPAMMESKDGLRWEALPPCKVEWGSTPSISHLEYGGCERIGGKYYLIGGTGGYMGNQGYAMFTFVADGPRGPFRPVGEMFRLCGNSGKNVTWLAAWSRARNELLISNYASIPVDGGAPWLLPLRKPVIDQNGQLHLGWWKGNEAIKGDPLALGKTAVTLTSEGKPGGCDVLYLDTKFNPDQGMVLEGRLKARACTAKAAAGFAIEENTDSAMVVQLGIGRPEGRETHIGRLTTNPDGTWTFASEDVTGKRCATITGVEDGKEHTFRLLCRMELFELYIDDMLVQTYTHQPGSGRVGFVVVNAKADYSNLKAWAMSFPEIPRLTFAGDTFFFDSARVDIRPVLEDGSEVRYTTDGSTPTPLSHLYGGPFTITSPATIKAALFTQGCPEPAASGTAQYVRALYPQPRYLQPYSRKWPGQGLFNLVDGARGRAYFDSYFQGFEFNDMDVVVDLGGKKEISDIRVTMLQDIRSWIFFPQRVEFFVSHDGANFEQIGEVPTVNENERKEGLFLKDYAVTFARRTTNFVRVKATNTGMCPPWHIGYEHKGKAWAFADEIVIR